jgi:uncharacterized membrane protein SpoIIM required for sporulation
MPNPHDVAMQIHMTFLNHKDSVEWISGFKEEITSLPYHQFETLIQTLEGISQAEEDNFTQAINSHNIPPHLQAKAATVANFKHLIEHIKLKYLHWMQEK